MQMAKRESENKHSTGKSDVGGEWQLLNVDGQLEGSNEMLGCWQLIYFGFTNCPDVCPEEIEKMLKVVDNLEKDKWAKMNPIVPVFISIDPDRDTPARVKQYCADFSSKLKGFTGSNEQVSIFNFETQ